MDAPVTDAHTATPGTDELSAGGVTADDALGDELLEEELLVEEVSIDGMCGVY